MKKILSIALVAIAAIGCAVSANAEKWYVGGSIGFWHESGNRGSYEPLTASNADTNQFSIMPELGYNFNNRWAVGGTIGYMYKHWCGLDQDYNVFKLNPYARFTYFRTSNNLVQLFIDGQVGIGLGAVDRKHQDTHTAVTYNIGLRPGIAINLTNRFSIVAHLGFVGYNGANNAAKDAGEKCSGGVNFDSNNLTLGFYYNF